VTGSTQAFVRVSAGESVAGESWFTCALVCVLQVEAVGIGTAWVGSAFVEVDTREAVACESSCAPTDERSHCIGAGGAGVTR